MDLLHLLKENFKNLLFESLITGKNFKNLSSLSSFSLSQRWRLRCPENRDVQIIRLNVLQGIESNLAYTKVLEVVSQHILRSRTLWHPLSSGMFKNEQIFSSVILKLMSAFSL